MSNVIAPAQSQDLKWLLIRKNSSHIVKQHSLPRVFSREPGNLRQLHSYKYSTLVNEKSVSIVPAEKGIFLTTKKAKLSKSQPGKVAGTHSTQLIKGSSSRRAAGKVANVVGKKGYRSDLLKDAVARTSAIYQSQRPSGRREPPARKVRGSGKNKVVFTSSKTSGENTEQLD